MSPNSERPTKMGIGDYGEVLSLESSVLRTLCLTVNAAGSELKYQIIDTLSEDDFYYPVNKAIFAALTDMHRRGDYVVYTNLEEELRSRAVDIPENLFVEDLFRGELPDLGELSTWVKRLKERSRGPRPAAPPKVASGATVEVRGPVEVRAPAEARPAIEARASAEVPAPAAAKPVVPAPDLSTIHVKVPSEPRVVVAKTERPAKPPAVKPEPAPERAPQVRIPALASEGDEWGSYLDDLASKQGRSIETGFAGLDEKAGGLSTGLMLLVDQDQGRRTSFLKQLTDQVAARMNVACLYVSFGTTKAMLRIGTLARLSGVPAADIERGRLKKDSPEWLSVERNGRRAAAWLKKVFVVEADATMTSSIIRDLGRRVLEEGGAGLVVVDDLDRLAQPQGTARGVLADLKRLSEDLNVLVVAATASEKALSESDVAVAAVLSGEGQSVRLEVLRVRDARSTTIPLHYQPAIHKFVEQSLP